MKSRRKALILIISAAVLLIGAGLFLIFSKPDAKIVSIKIEPLESDLIDTAWEIWEQADGRYEQKLWKGEKPTGSDYVRVTFTVRITNLSVQHWYAAAMTAKRTSSSPNGASLRLMTSAA